MALKAGLPIETPALTVNRLCGSGMQAIVTAAQMMRLGEAKMVLAGGMESMSQAPHVLRGARYGLALGEGKLEDSLMVALLDTQCGLYMANTAELYAELQRWASDSGRSVNAEVLDVLDREAAARAQHEEWRRRLQALRSEITPATAPPWPEDLIRDDRDHGHRRREGV